jgi:hypothetical protein
MAERIKDFDCQISNAGKGIMGKEEGRTVPNSLFHADK